MANGCLMAAKEHLFAMTTKKNTASQDINYLQQLNSLCVV